jgi:peptide/nickel transport system substrate-binding protein
MALRFRYVYRLLIAFLGRFKGLIILGIILGIVIFLLINIFIPIYLKSSVKRIGIIGMYATDELPSNITSLISKGLTVVNEKGELSPGIAKTWETTDMGKTWLFTLDESLNWQDGKQILSEDVNYDFKDVEIERPNKKQVLFKLKNKFSPFPYVVSRPLFKRGLMGVGEWGVDKIIIEKEVVDELRLKNKSGERIIYQFFPTEERAKLALKLGRLNSIEEVYTPAPFEKWKTVKTIPVTNYNQIITLFLNNKKDNLSDKSFRQALNYAIDKNSADLARAISPISEIAWAYNPQVKNYNYDLKKALELSKDLTKGSKNEISINLFVTPTLLTVAEKIVKDWKAIKVNANLVVTSTIPVEYDAFLAILDLPEDPDQYSLWHSTQNQTNIAKYSSQRVDKLLEDGRAELSLEERKKIYFDFQRYLVEDCPAVFLYYPTVYKIERK